MKQLRQLCSTAKQLRQLCYTMKQLRQLCYRVGSESEQINDRNDCAVNFCWGPATNAPVPFACDLFSH